MKILIVLTTLFSFVFASGKLQILYHPDSVDFKEKPDIESDSITELFSSVLGYSVENPSGWQGLYINQPFYLPKAVVLFSFEGIDGISVSNRKKPIYSIIGTASSNALDNLESIIDQNEVVMDIDLNRGYDALLAYNDRLVPAKPFVSEKSTALKPQLFNEDKLLLEQINVINTISKNLESDNDKPSLLVFRVNLNDFINAHKTSNAAVSDGLKLLSDSIENFIETAKKAYNDNVVVATMSLIDSMRYKRDTSAKISDVPDNIVYAKKYSEDYPVIFNIILWFGVVFIFSLLAICVVIATMDPGRDSIIYRMTLNRMKKEN